MRMARSKEKKEGKRRRWGGEPQWRDKKNERKGEEKY